MIAPELTYFGAVHDTVAVCAAGNVRPSPRTTVGDPATNPTNAADVLDLPAALVAVTTNVYAVPFFKPITMQEKGFPGEFTVNEHVLRTPPTFGDVVTT